MRLSIVKLYYRIRLDLNSKDVYSVPIVIHIVDSVRIEEQHTVRIDQELSGRDGRRPL